MSFSSYSDDNSDGYGNVAAQVDFDAVSIPESIVDRHRTVSSQRRASKMRAEPLPDLVGSSMTDTILLISQDGGALSWRRWLVGPFCFLYMAAFITSYSTVIQYAYYKIQKDLYPAVDRLNETGACENVNTSSPGYQMQINVQESASTWSIYFSLAGGVPAVFSNVILGSTSDKYGRKFLFFLPCLGTLVRMLVTLGAIYWNWDLIFMTIGYIVEGMTGQMFTMLLVCFTYVADTTSERGRQRSFGITMVELSIGIAVAGFSFSTGYFIEDYGFYYPMLSAVIMMTACLILVFFIPESLPATKRNTSGSVLDTIKTAYDLFFGEFNRGRRWMYNVLLTCFGLTMFIVFGRSSVEPLYQLGEPFCWSPEKLGYFR